MKEILKYIQLYTGCNDHALKRIEVILQDKLNPAPKVEIRYIEKFARKGIAPELPLQKFADGYCLLNNTTIADLKNKCRKTPVVINRNRFVISAYREGYGASELGRFLNFCHASILHGLHESKKK
jgi:hypothetical protein